MAAADPASDELRDALRDLRRGTIDAATARAVIARRKPGNLAALFGSALLPRREAAVLAALRRECELLERAPFQPGETIAGRYEVRSLHRGGFGLVYVCRQLGPEQYARSGNLVALKTPLPRHLASPELREMFLAEAAHCVALGPHPNLVLAYGLAEHDRLPYLVLEYIPRARSLQDEIIRGATGWRTALRAGLGVARGLAFAGLVHGDLKPANLLLGPDGAAKVADFGLALPPDESPDEAVLAGTPGFLAPEMLAGRPGRTIATDVYAYGVVLYLGATRHFPFPPDAPALALTARAPDPRGIDPAIPPEVARLILLCLERDPARRPGSFGALAAELAELHRRLLGTEPSADPAPDAPTRADALVNAAQSWVNLGRFADARAAATRALRLAPDNWKAHHALGLALLAENELSSALASFNAAHEFAPAALEPVANAAQAAAGLGRTDDARRWFKLAVGLGGGEQGFAALDGCSQLAIELLPPAEALGILDRILAENPRAAMTWNNRAALMRRMKEPGQALNSAERALALNPTYAKAYVQKANALVELRRFDEALDAADRSLALDDTLAGAYAAKATALAQLGRLPEARASIREGLRRLPANPLLLRAREVFDR